jgi:uncharacterized protein YbjT (DUF2867 family)
MNHNILVLGGTGFVGRSICEQLVARGNVQVVVPSRRPASAKHLLMMSSVRVAKADVHDLAQLKALVQGCSAVINLVAMLHGSSAEFEHVHVELPRKLAQACASNGVNRVVHVSALGVGPSAPSNYLRSKTAGETMLRAANLALTTLRPSVIFGAHDKFLNLFAKLQAFFPVIPLAGASAQFQPVWVEDVATAVVRSINHRHSIGQTIECAGPEIYTLKALVQAVGRWSGHVRPVLPLPNSVGYLQALMMELLPGSPLMSRDNILSMRAPNVASGKRPGLSTLGITPATVGSVAPSYLNRKP